MYSRELARLQTIPDEIELSPVPRVNQRLIGNAIPSLMGEILGKEIKKQIFGISSRTKISLLQDCSPVRVRTHHEARIPSHFLRQMSVQ
jgi:DNA (cytosine-5)-methyltransferase 1